MMRQETIMSVAALHYLSVDVAHGLQSHDDAQTVGVIDNQYFYDGDGRRVKKVVGSVSTIYVYDIQGQMVAEYTDYITTQSSGTSYLTADNLGTPRVITNNEGAVISRHDYLPFGEEISVGVDGRTASQGYVNDGVREKFTGKERDDETGLDYFDARYYANTQGRFTSCDPKGLSLKQVINPQRWNRFAYVLNNPLSLYDPDGQDDQGQGGGRVIDVFFTMDKSERRFTDSKGRDVTTSKA